MPSLFVLPETVGRSFRHLMTGAIAMIVKRTPSKKAFEVDFGSVPFEPATIYAAIGPSM